jgi:beta-glucuronidase
VSWGGGGGRGAAGPATAQTPADTPQPGALYDTGADGKYLLGGTWLHRLDAADEGLQAGLSNPQGTEGWEPVTVPHVWNAKDLSVASMVGSIGWYRKDFTLPDDKAARSWVVRFESANYRLQAWLNGRPIGRHEGAYLPFELKLSGLVKGTNTLVVRIDSRTNQFDLPPGGPDANGVPDGGWWNYGGLPREVYLRRVGAADFVDVYVRSSLRCRTCEATVQLFARVRNTSDRAREIKLSGTFGTAKLDLGGGHRIRAGQTRQWKKRFTLDEPSLWSPVSPSLYRVRLKLDAGDGHEPGYFVRHGIRSIKVVKGGRFMFNGRPVALRGASVHEDDPEVGNALSHARRRADIDLLRRLGATITRAHYPVHPYFLELCDRFGILYWDQAPVYQLRATQLGNLDMRRRAVDFVRRQVIRDRNHASVISFSLVNELPARPGSGQEKLIAQMAAAVRKLDDQRLVALDILGYPQVGPQEAYRVVDAIGVNDYFGWYPGPNGTTANRADLPGYLDQLHAAYPEQALFITEFGAEANREGPIDEKGTYAFQREFLGFHLDTYTSREFVNAALIWILRDFRVKPGWEGGNPKPEPPVNFKGLVSQTGEEKPAFGEIARIFRATRQLR